MSLMNDEWSVGTQLAHEAEARRQEKHGATFAAASFRVVRSGRVVKRGDFKGNTEACDEPNAEPLVLGLHRTKEREATVAAFRRGAA